MKKKIYTIIFSFMLLISTINILNLNPIKIPKVKAQSPPYELVKNPWLNDSDYWTCEVAWELQDSFSNITSEGWHSYAKKSSLLIQNFQLQFWRWWQPYGCTFALQGMFPSTVPCEPTTKGQGLNYYVYIPANISDGQIIANITQMRLKDPEWQGDPFFGYPFGKNPIVAVTDRTNIGIYFFLALKVKFWDSPLVPERLRGKETYLGWTTPRFPNKFYGGCVHAGHIETWTDTRVYNKYDHEWCPASVESGFPDFRGVDPIDYPGFMGSTQDWDMHNSRALNNTPLNEWETLTYDVGKRFRELVEWWDTVKYNEWPCDGLLSNGRFLTIVGSGGRGFPCLHRQAYDIVGAMLLGVGPTIEVLNGDMEVKVNWVQVYDYRDDGGHPPDDPLFWDCLEHWKWLKSKGFHDPCQDHWVNAILPEETLQFRIVDVGYSKSWETCTIVKSSEYMSSVEITDDYPNTVCNLTVHAGVDYPFWAKAGAEYKYEFTPDQLSDLRIKVHSYWEYNLQDCPSWGNEGLYLDYKLEVLTTDGSWTSLEEGEVIFDDHLSEDHVADPDKWYHYYDVLSFNFSYEIADAVTYTLSLTPHIEAWYSALWARNFMEVYVEHSVMEEITYTLTVDVNNPSYGTVTPSGTTEYFAMSTVTLTATPASGYYFIFWRVQNTMHAIAVDYYDNPLTLHMNMDYNVTAYFSDTPESPPNVTLTLSRQFILPSDVPSPYRIWGDIPPYPMICHNGNCGEGSWEYSVGSTISLQTIEPQGYKWLGWYNLTKEMYYTFTIEKDCIAVASWMPPLIKIIVKDACSFQPVSDFIVTVYKSGQEDYYFIDQSEFIFIGEPRSYKITISKLGAYYAKTVYVTPDAYGSPLEVFLNPVTFSGGSGGGGGGGLHYVRSKKFMFKFTVLNASSTEYVIWNNMVKVTPIAGATATLTLRVHYTTTYPIIEVYAENIAMVKFNWTDIYHSLNCPYFDRVSTLTRFYGVSINTTDPIILDMGLPAKPKELWKLTPDQELPGTLLTDWQWNNGRVLLQIIPGDPTVSMLLQSALERARDIPFEFLPLIVTVAMLLVLFKFIKDKL